MIKGGGREVKKSVRERGQGNVKEGEMTKKGGKGRGMKREKKGGRGASVHNVSERQLEWG